ncbi:hypothetical protein ACWEQA_24135 [Nocardia sp. NPDC004085]
MRPEFSSTAAAHRWFDEYVNSRTSRVHGSCNGIRGGSASAVMQIYRHRHDEVPIARLRSPTTRTAHAASSTRPKATQSTRAQRLPRRVVSTSTQSSTGIARRCWPCSPTTTCPGANPFDHAAPLSRRFTVDDMADDLVLRIWADIRYAIGRHPLAARLYVAAAGSRTLGWDLYADQVRKWCGFRWPSGARELHAYMVRLSHSIPVVHVIERNRVLIDSASVRRWKQ